jgi:hypothetical protein
MYVLSTLDGTTPSDTGMGVVDTVVCALHEGLMPPASFSGGHGKDKSGRPVLGVLTNWRLSREGRIRICKEVKGTHKLRTTEGGNWEGQVRHRDRKKMSKRGKR